jgi:peptidoglycan hydrolase-like protein with peptidoglycan-binding domain
MNFDFMALINVLANLPAYIRQITEIWNETSTNEDYFDMLQRELPVVLSLISSIFPENDNIQNAITVAQAFNMKLVKWVQTAANLADDAGLIELSGDKLVIDGYYGLKTKAAVEKLQAAAGAGVDGWLGKLTQQAIENLHIPDLPKL